jgi:hypothetical protein
MEKALMTAAIFFVPTLLLVIGFRLCGRKALGGWDTPTTPFFGFLALAT